MTDARAQAAIETVIRLESARLIAGLAHYTGDIGLAEDLAQDAVVAALEQWPADGVPRNPGAWLMTVAKRRAIDFFRRNIELEKKYAQIGRALEAEGDAVRPDFDQAFSDDIDDDLLRLIFTACHPVLSVQARVALTLRVLGGLTTAEIARAYLVPEPTIAQRIVRAKKTLAQANVPFEVPDALQRPARLSSVLEVRDTRRPQAMIGCARPCAPRPCASAACWPSSRPLNRKCMAWSRCWRSRRPGSPPGPGRLVIRCCCSTRTGRAGTGC